MSSHNLDQTQDGTQTGSRAPSTCPATIGPRGNIVPASSELGTDASVDITEGGVTFPHSLQNHGYKFVVTASGATVEGHRRDDPSAKLRPQSFTCGAKLSVNSPPKAADGSEASISELKAFRMSAAHPSIITCIDAYFEEPVKAPEKSSKQPSEDPLKQAPSQSKPKSYADLFASEDF